MGRRGKLFWVLRFCIYAAVIAAIAVYIPLLIGDGNTGVVTENNPTDAVAAIPLLAAAVAFWIASRRRHAMRHLCLLVGLLCAIGAVRESNAIFIATPRYNWRVPAAVLGIVFLYLTFTWRRHIGSQIEMFLAVPAINALWVIALLVMLLSQLLGPDSFTAPTSHDPSSSGFACVIEEVCELIGYAILLFGAIEIAIFATPSKASDTPTALIS